MNMTKTINKKIVICFIVFLSLFLSIPTANAADSSYTTNSYDVSIRVNENNTYDVTEKISVDFLKESHGIYRNIPIGTSKELGHMSISDINVSGRTFETYTEDGNEVIKIGDEDKTLTGDQDYYISYKVTISKDRDEANDYFYFDVLPSGWQSTIKKSTIEIYLPKAINTDDLTVYAGAYGSTDTKTNNVAYNYDEVNNKITIKASNIPANYGITVMAKLDEGYWQGVKTYDSFKVISILIGILVPLLLLGLWYLFGRDKKIIETVEFYPPEGLTPAEIGYVIDETIDQRDLASMVIYYAEKGYLSIEQKGKKDFILSKLKDIDEEEKSFSKILFNGFFEKKDVVNLKDLDETFGDAYLAAREELSDLCNKKENRTSTLKSQFFQILGTILLLGSQIGIIFLSSWYSGGVSALSIMGAIISFVVVIAFSIFQNKIHVVKSGTRAILSVLLWILLAASNIIFGIGLGESIDSFVLGIIIGILYIVGCGATVFMKKRTENSIVLMGKILGLKNFIKKAELDRINKLVEENPNYFFDILPYAYVMGLTDKWAKNFKSITTVNPSWYINENQNIDMFDVIVFSSMMNRCGQVFNDNVNLNIVSNDSDGASFGSGGGGFSGGGFGGGGGGSW